MTFVSRQRYIVPMKFHHLILVFAVALLAACGKTPYDNPIGNNSVQPDKKLFDKAILDIEKHKYDVGRLTLQTLINTYPDSEYLAKAKLAIADSWYREGTGHALAQAEAEYKDFITFFPTMEEAAESQMKVCDIHYEQMAKPDRDTTHALKADQECRQLMMQWPNSVFLDQTKQRLREVQELLAEGEYRVGTFYTTKGSYRSGANRLQAMSDHYPLFSKNDEALWELGNTYGQMGEQFEDQMIAAYQRIVREYPMSVRVPEAKAKLEQLNATVPEPDPERLEVNRYNVENRVEKGMVKKSLTIFGTRPDLRMAAKMGEPAMTTLMPSTPPGIRPTAEVTGGAAPSAEVSVQPIGEGGKLESEPDARRSKQPDEQAPANSQPQQP
ncbi:MAG: outer membrane protein assembly factor BamD [Acidobacteria bacterium]|nr:outer membrane protein assembly factor BamD [Acidobacteriota bacterium]